MTYNGLALNTGALAGDIFLNNTLNTMLDVVGIFVVQFLMNRSLRCCISRTAFI